MKGFSALSGRKFVRSDAILFSFYGKCSRKIALRVCIDNFKLVIYLHYSSRSFHHMGNNSESPFGGTKDSPASFDGFELFHDMPEG